MERNRTRLDNRAFIILTLYGFLSVQSEPESMHAERWLLENRQRLVGSRSTYSPPRPAELARGKRQSIFSGGISRARSTTGPNAASRTACRVFGFVRRASSSRFTEGVTFTLRQLADASTNSSMSVNAFRAPHSS